MEGYSRGGFGGRSGGRSSGGFGGRGGGRSGGFGGRDRGFGGRGGDRERRPLEMHDAVCAKCKKACQVPFKPTQGKQVLCSDCFKESGGGSRDRQSSGISSEQFNQINAKLDKIIKIMESLELDIEDEDSEESEEDSKEN
ncbi:MAG: CxxC-x17-CxxC domain-containing protein [Candidatus Paceibacterota bacterium]